MKKILLLFGLIISSLAFSQQYVPAGGVFGQVLGVDPLGKAVWQNASNSTGQLYFVTAATTTTLSPVTYSSGTLTAVSNGRLANIDGIKLMLGDSVLIKNESAQLRNGIYIISDTGTVSTTAKMYRNHRYDTLTEVYPSQVNVLSGTVNAGAYFIQTRVNPVVGTSPLIYSSVPPPTGWSLTGNGATNPATNFIGTLDAQPFIIRTNNSERIRVLSSGNVGIGTSSPTARFHVVGTLSKMACDSFNFSPTSANGSLIMGKNYGVLMTGSAFGTLSHIHVKKNGDILTYSGGNTFMASIGNHSVGANGAINIQSDQLSSLPNFIGMDPIGDIGNGMVRIASGYGFDLGNNVDTSDASITMFRTNKKIVLRTPLSTDSINLSRNPPANDSSRQVPTTAWTKDRIAATTGVWKIYNSAGVPAAYSTYALAAAAATSGQTIELSADVIQSVGTNTLVPGVNVNLNGHTLTMTTSNTVAGFIDNGVAYTGKVTNGTIIKTATNSSNPVMNLTSSLSVVDFTGTTIITSGASTYGVESYGKVSNLTVSAGYIPLVMFSGSATNVKATFTTADGYGIYATNAKLSKCSVNDNGLTTTATALIYLAGGCTANYCETVSTSSVATCFYSTGTNYLNHCNSSIQASGLSYAAFQGNGSEYLKFCEATSPNCIGFLGCGTMSNCDGYSSSYIAMFNCLKNYNCTFVGGRAVNAVYADVPIKLKNCIIENITNNSLAYAIYLEPTAGTSVITNCDISVSNASAYCIYGSSATNVQYANNTYQGATTPLSNITQYINVGNVSDTQGNVNINH